MSGQNRVLDDIIGVGRGVMKIFSSAGRSGFSPAERKEFLGSVLNVRERDFSSETGGVTGLENNGEFEIKDG